MSYCIAVNKNTNLRYFYKSNIMTGALYHKNQRDFC